MNIGKVLQVEITVEVQKSYLNYAMSVIVSRALPDVRDGLKPVHRRILFAMHQMGLVPASAYTKSAKIVGETMGKFHPHGDGPIYDALVRLAQNFSMRYPLVDGQGNYGSVDGDPPAAMRYTEARPAKISQELLADIEKDTVEFGENFDSTIKEPNYLPATLPNLLLMGSEGIAVGMATKIPPHNLNEVVEAIIATIEKGSAIAQDKGHSTQDTGKNGKESADFVITDKRSDISNSAAEFAIKKIDLAVAEGRQKDITIVAPVTDFDSEITTEELVKYIKGPDFPTGGVIYGAKHMTEIYGTGRGTIVVRGVAKIEEAERGKSRIMISELPYQVNKALLVAKIAELARDKKIVGISDLRDESDQKGMSVVIELKKDARPKSVLNNLYKHTQLQNTFPANFVALVDGTPRTLALKQILVEYVKHRQKVVTRRSIYDLTEAKKRGHILEGLVIALDHLDEVIATIRKSRDSDTAKTSLMEKFKFTEIQAVAILDMQLRRLSALEREKIEEEYKKIQELITHLTDLLMHPEKILGLITSELTALKEKYGDERRTKIYMQPVGEISEQDLVAREEVLIMITKTGYIKRVPRSTYKSQARGGKGVIGMTTKEEDEIAHLVAASTHDQVMFFTDRGRVFSTRAWEIAEGSRQAKGQAIVNLINIDQGEVIEAVVVLDGTEVKYLLMATRKGTVKKTALSQFKNLRTSGLIAIRLDRGDALAWVRQTTGEDQVIMATQSGKSIRFKEGDVRPMGRDSHGVRGIMMSAADQVISMEVFPEKENIPTDRRKKFFRDILVVTQRGLGKRTPVSAFPLQKRGGSGVKIAELSDKTGELACAMMVTENIEQIIITSRSGQVIRLPLKNIPQLGRATQGVILMRFGKDKSDKVAAVAILDKEEIEAEPVPIESENQS
ncbi:MAG: DNA gyrase subunit A [Candidatus Blackburnbacteria bacterium RIFCSPLOWO2_01_FULL_41_27]|uniref:DNA gyrase subunit A n=1 Tax=Candidatus Blackburnbacteria bacterium RIFCSPLOWO2_01_FULL_41_27 TaxID=1797520 RepID=A0A1G1VGJ0_9BACT|nr:MAG: DNA gyrase subunit A [Candidatus Blackburnbacteria bacterium RIFCSPLOWO2_01_FULL_41_27]